MLACIGWVGCDERPWVSGKADPKEENNYRQAEAYQRMNQYPKAVEYYQRALDVNPRNADAHLGLGIIHSDSAKLPEYGFAYYHLRRYISLSGKTNDLIVNQLIRATACVWRNCMPTPSENPDPRPTGADAPGKRRPAQVGVVSEQSTLLGQRPRHRPSAAGFKFNQLNDGRSTPRPGLSHQSLGTRTPANSPPRRTPKSVHTENVHPEIR